jgi:hypothetical protein
LIWLRLFNEAITGGYDSDLDNRFEQGKHRTPMRRERGFSPLKLHEDQLASRLKKASFSALVKRRPSRCPDSVSIRDFLDIVRRLP